MIVGSPRTEDHDENSSCDRQLEDDGDCSATSHRVPDWAVIHGPCLRQPAPLGSLPRASGYVVGRTAEFEPATLTFATRKVRVREQVACSLTCENTAQ